MYTLLLRDPHQPERIGFTRIDALTIAAKYPDYQAALRALREETRRLSPQGVLLLTTLHNQSDLAHLDMNDFRVGRSAFGSAWEKPVEVTLTLTDENRHNLLSLEHDLTHLQANQPLTPERQCCLDQLTQLLDHLQDGALLQGTPRGILWPDRAIGQMERTETQLAVDNPRMARLLGILPET